MIYKSLSKDLNIISINLPKPIKEKLTSLVNINATFYLYC